MRAGRRAARLSHLARAAATIVMFMAGNELAGVRRALLDAGLPGDTPAAVIESGTLPDERVGRGPLSDLESLLPSRAGGPVLVVVGRSVALGDRLRAAPRPRRVKTPAGGYGTLPCLAPPWTSRVSSRPSRR